MTMPTRIERNLPAILEDLSMAPVPDYLDDVFGQTGALRQRPAWTFPERWIPMAEVARLRAVAPAPPWRLIAIGLLILALVAAALLAVGATQRRPALPFGPARNGGIAYSTDGDIYVGDPVSGESKLIVGGPRWESGPGFSPDGTRFAFLRRADSPSRVNLVVARADGSDPRVLTDAPLNAETWINWTPDSRHLAAIIGTESGNQIRLLDADGLQPPRVIDPKMAVDALVFRPPDGDEIAFRSLVEGKWGIFAMNADGTNVHALQQPSVPEDMGLHAQVMAYTPDGKRLFYQSYAKGLSDDGSDGCCQLWVMNADGSDAHRFRGDVGAWAGIPTVSPDGKWVAFWGGVTNGRPVVHVAAADGTGPIIETGPPNPGVAPWAWSPDSSKILLTPAQESGQAFLLDPAGGDYTTVPWGSAELDWQRLAP